ncbi:MAG: biotin--[acetyl-CoA-carboxylase] ligase [Candidatus Velthaea sp.]
MSGWFAPLDVARIQAELAGTRFADVRYLAKTSSTNADAQPVLADAAHAGATLVAERQTEGVGRKGRAWVAPAGSSLLFTTILPVAVEAASLWAVPFWIALGVADGVERACGATLDLVWPNDLFARGRKCGGILSVSRIVGRRASVGCGVGLNVLRPTDEADVPALVPPPLFLSELTPSPSRESILANILRAFDRSLGLLNEPDAIANAWERRAALAGTPYRFVNDRDGVERTGTALRIGPHGTLIVRTERGEEVVDMADVRVVRET